MKGVSRTLGDTLPFWIIPCSIAITTCVFLSDEGRTFATVNPGLPIGGSVILVTLLWLPVFCYQLGKQQTTAAKIQTKPPKPCGVCANNMGFAECECSSCCGCSCSCECGCDCHDQEDADNGDKTPEPAQTADVEEADAVVVA